MTLTKHIEYVSGGPRPGADMTILPGYNAETYSTASSATISIPYPNFSVTGEILTYLWNKRDTQDTGMSHPGTRLIQPSYLDVMLTHTPWS